MHELAVMAQSIDEMKVNIAWITECFCSGVIVVTNLVDNKLIFVTTNCLSFYEHELLEFLRTRIFRITRILSLWLFSLSVYLHSFDSLDSCSFQHELLADLRTRIIRMTRMSPLGSFACVSCLIYIRSIRLIRVRFNTCLRFYEHEYFELHESWTYGSLAWA